MQPSVIPSIWDLGGLVGYLWGNPLLFISSTTVMTTGLIFGAVAVSALPQRSAILRAVAPTLAIILIYFGLGSFALATQILLRFHHEWAYGTEVQFISGLGHLIEAAVGVVILTPFLRRQTRRAWLWGHTLAIAYWTFQVAVLTPPWFSFQGQRELVMRAVLTLLTLAAAVNVLCWVRLERSEKLKGRERSIS